MRIVYIGDDNPLTTSAHRANALHRLDHNVTHLNLDSVLPRWRYLKSFNIRTGFRLYARKVHRELFRRIGDQKFDMVWVDCGPTLGPAVYREFKARGWKTVNYNIDDPFGCRDYRKWDLYKLSVPYHDLTVVVRDENIPEAKARGAQRVLRVFRSYDPVAHAPVAMQEDERRKWKSEVVFVGTWMPERGSFMMRLLESGVPLSIWGDHWKNAPEREKLRSVYKGPAAYGADYVKAIQSAKIALGMLSKGNRDLHTTRSAEVPFVCGAVFCAERTTEHEMLYADGNEAVFWSSAEECARRCRELLSNEQQRAKMATAARQRVVAWRLSNDEILAAILRRLAGQSPDHPLAAEYSRSEANGR